MLLLFEWYKTFTIEKTKCHKSSGIRTLHFSYRKFDVSAFSWKFNICIYIHIIIFFRTLLSFIALFILIGTGIDIFTEIQTVNDVIIGVNLADSEGEKTPLIDQTRPLGEHTNNTVLGKNHAPWYIHSYIYKIEIWTCDYLVINSFSVSLDWRSVDMM